MKHYEPDCYKCENALLEKQTIRCLMDVRGFPQYRCEQFISEAGTDWNDLNEATKILWKGR